MFHYLREFDKARDVLHIVNSSAYSITKSEASDCFSAILLAASPKHGHEALHSFRKRTTFLINFLHHQLNFIILTEVYFSLPAVKNTTPPANNLLYSDLSQMAQAMECFAKVSQSFWVFALKEKFQCRFVNSLCHEFIIMFSIQTANSYFAICRNSRRAAQQLMPHFCQELPPRLNNSKTYNAKDVVVSGPSA